MANLEKGFLILYEWLPAIHDLPPKELKNLLLALIYLQKDGTELPCFTNKKTDIFARMIEPVIRRRLTGKNNSTPKAYPKVYPEAYPKAMVEDTPEAYPEAKRREDKRREDKRNIRGSKETPSPEAPTLKTAYGEFANVYLTEAERKWLLEKYGESVSEGLINHFSQKIKAKGYQYDDHYATILNWADKDGIKPKEDKSYDLEEFWEAALRCSYEQLEEE